MITTISRYNNGTLTRIPNSKGVYNLTVFRTVPPATLSFKLYVWQVADRPDLVALRELGNANLWWMIFDLNPELIYPLNVAPGTLVRIPTGSIPGHGALIQ